ncbi:MAG: cell division ATP-binding protein FtsE [Candidatus Berkelbacteria bacterium Athens1014_28]|uniref:Cell division ATP-binding protein FtsE n=1 Tax=Candidatus Berkelbacteria bacterium Athens1014_28 TaxID=2017145 RepID=A0A554LJ97_9BACT|nr:MAG: cell division ATP-binding protein FtsE [Candidatus Berkelbacteria bacterium Athens1014_28]
MIRYQNVSKVFPNGTEAVSGVNFSIDQGEFAFLCGSSGAGKTTLLRFLIREDVPTDGEIWFNEENIVSLPEKFVPELRRNIGMIFQDFKLLPRRTVFENVAFALEVSGKSDFEIAQIVPYMLQRVGLDNKMEAFPTQLSSGEAQRVAIARALVHEPEVLLADEPTGNLDYENSWQIVELLNQINEWGATVIMATHDTEIVKALKKRVIKIDKGQIVES